MWKVRCFVHCVLCSQLIKFYRSHFEWLDKVKCRLDWACGFVTRGAYVPGLGLVECPGEHFCQFDCFQDGVQLHSSDFIQYQICFFHFHCPLNSELRKTFKPRTLYCEYIMLSNLNPHIFQCHLKTLKTSSSSKPPLPFSSRLNL